MYQEFFNLKKSPFHITPDPEFLFLSQSHKQALASIIYGVEERKGFIAIVGEVGVGKTTILRSYLDSVDKAKIKIIYTFNPDLSFEGVLKFISRELGIEEIKPDIFDMVEDLSRKLIEEYSQGRNIVFIVDEAQNMPVETLEHLRMLSNLETSKDKLIQIVLIGQPELEEILDRHELRQLKQRIAIYSTISPLNDTESFDYIRFRLSQATRSNFPVFTKGAVEKVVGAARGIPRSINIICDNALITGFGYQRKPVTAKIVKEVIGDLKKKPVLRLKRAAMVLAAAAAISAIAFFSLSDDAFNFSNILDTYQQGARTVTEPARKSNVSGSGQESRVVNATRPEATTDQDRRRPLEQETASSQSADAPAASPVESAGKAAPDSAPGTSATLEDKQTGATRLSSGPKGSDETPGPRDDDPLKSVRQVEPATAPAPGDQAALARKDPAPATGDNRTVVRVPPPLFGVGEGKPSAQKDPVAPASDGNPAPRDPFSVTAAIDGGTSRETALSGDAKPAAQTGQAASAASEDKPSARKDPSSPVPGDAQSAGRKGPPPSEGAIMVRTVKRGDSLIRIAAEAYNLTPEEVIKRKLMEPVMHLNPHLANINRIDIGEKIFLPNLKVSEKAQDRAN